MLHGFLSELKKARRRRDLLLIAGTALVILAWVAYSLRGMGVQDRAQGFSGLFYVMPTVNTIVLSVVTAVLASRIWDVENRGNTCKLLFTLQSRASLYGGKVLLGAAELLLLCVLELAGIFALSGWLQFTQPLDTGRLAWLFACTFVVSMALFFLSLCISMAFAAQVATLAVGLGGALVGLFSAFFPPPLGYLTPWGYYIALSAMGYTWDEATRVTTYLPQPLPVGLLCVVAALAAALCALGGLLIKNREV